MLVNPICRFSAYDRGGLDTGGKFSQCEGQSFERNGFKEAFSHPGLKTGSPLFVAGISRQADDDDIAVFLTD